MDLLCMYDWLCMIVNSHLKRSIDLGIKLARIKLARITIVRIIRTLKSARIARIENVIWILNTKNINHSKVLFYLHAH